MLFTFEERGKPKQLFFQIQQRDADFHGNLTERNPYFCRRVERELGFSDVILTDFATPSAYVVQS